MFGRGRRRHQCHEQTHPQSCGSRKLVKVEPKGVGCVGEFDGDGGDGARGAEHQQRLRPRQRVHHTGHRVHEEVLCQPHAVGGPPLRQRAESDGREEGGEEHEERGSQGFGRVPHSRHVVRHAPRPPLGCLVSHAIAQAAKWRVPEQPALAMLAAPALALRRAPDDGQVLPDATRFRPAVVDPQLRID
eukprot:scaffold2075_cov101-Isochrysis_galbana.AAC.4